MRGEYVTTDNDRNRFYYHMLKFCRSNEDILNLTKLNLSLRDCDFLLGELGYEQNNWEVDSGEGEIWCSYIQQNMPKIIVVSDAYLGSLKLYWSDEQDNEGGSLDNSELIINLMKECWGNIF